MRIGVFVSETWGPPSDVDEVRRRAAEAEQAGMDSVWVPYLPWAVDALAAAQAAGGATSRVEVGTAVVPTYLFHPLALARQAATVDEAIGGRLTLGIGPSQRTVIESMHGVEYRAPARHTSEYLDVLGAAWANGPRVEVRGEHFQVDAMYGVPGARPVPVLVGALGPLMLDAAGSRADGTIATMCDPGAIERVVVPGITAAAAAAGRPAPRVGTVVPLCVTDDVDAAREAAATHFGVYDRLPRYRRMVELGDGARAADVCVVGGEAQVRAALARYRDAGLTDLLAAPFAGGQEAVMARRRLLDALGGLVGA